MKPARSLAPLTLLRLMVCSLLALPVLADPFADYWYGGEAEITSYDLEQARYGEVHPGEAVLIFVTEDFSASKQVKLDDPAAAGEDRVPVLKLNFTKKFHTGLYPYSMMSSVFTPIEPGDGATLKVTTSSQEWCGHTFTQANRTAAGYGVRQLSYFESEGDVLLDLEGARLEDELWNLIRLDPDRLPVGELELVPGTRYLRLRHVPIAAYAAVASRGPAEEAGLVAYRLRYPRLGRELEIRYTADFPHTIAGWSETYRSGWGAGAAELTTRATRRGRLENAYWRHNRLEDAALRQRLE